MNVRNRIFVFVSVLFFGFCLSGCGVFVDSQEFMVEMPDDVQESEPWREQEVMCTIRITAEDTVLQGILYDNLTARGFAEMLPLTVDLWHPAPDFARAFEYPTPDHYEPDIRALRHELDAAGDSAAYASGYDWDA